VTSKVDVDDGTSAIAISVLRLARLARRSIRERVDPGAPAIPAGLTAGAFLSRNRDLGDQAAAFDLAAPVSCPGIAHDLARGPDRHTAADE
jgi:hypothetical protein